MSVWVMYTVLDSPPEVIGGMMDVTIFVVSTGRVVVREVVGVVLVVGVEVVGLGVDVVGVLGVGDGGCDVVGGALVVGGVGVGSGSAEVVGGVGGGSDVVGGN